MIRHPAVIEQIKHHSQVAMHDSKGHRGTQGKSKHPMKSTQNKSTAYQFKNDDANDANGMVLKSLRPITHYSQQNFQNLSASFSVVSVDFLTLM